MKTISQQRSFRSYDLGIKTASMQQRVLLMQHSIQSNGKAKHSGGNRINMWWTKLTYTEYCELLSKLTKWYWIIDIGRHVVCDTGD